MKKTQEWVFLSHQSSVLVHHPLFRHIQKNLNAIQPYIDEDGLEHLKGS